MKIVSWNVNGIRSAGKQGFWDWFKKCDADAVCLQELKIDENAMNGIAKIDGYQAFFNFAEKKGYSGVAIYLRNSFNAVAKKFSLGLERFDNEGRYIELDLGDFILINIYIPHGGRQKENLKYKLNVYEKLFERLKELSSRKIILCGDFNIAHEEIDLARPKSNKNNIMFTPEERAIVDQVLNSGFTDTFRKFHDDGGHYTWWPWLKNCRDRNLGWRIDYIFASDNIQSKIRDGLIFEKILGSDHCPIGIKM
ncbi:MAG: exodeoxyribonuclease III [Patescibacteria group bacterium]|jgi:exodeoxyribonuclease-3